MSYIKKALVASLSTCVISSVGFFGFGAQAHADTYHIGSILSVTGPAAFLGDDMKAGMEMAIDDINAPGGIDGKKETWTFYDADSKTAKAITATKRMISKDKEAVSVASRNKSAQTKTKAQ